MNVADQRVASTSRRSERARVAILEAAYDLLLDEGFLAMTIEGIAARAGVGKQTIYRWWPSKSAVVFDAALHAGEQAAEDGGLPDTGDLAADLRLVLHAIVDELRDERRSAAQRTIMVESMHDHALAEKVVEHILRPQLELTKDRLRSAVRAGQLGAATDIDALPDALYGPIFYRWMLRARPLDHAFADQILSTVLEANS
jgi:AcrR family transcriptional regulator